MSEPNLSMASDQRFPRLCSLQEEECIWLVNEIENWLNVDTAERHRSY